MMIDVNLSILLHSVLVVLGVYVTLIIFIVMMTMMMMPST